MGKQEEDEISRYLAETNGWLKSLNKVREESEKKAWRITFASLGVAAIAVAAVAGLTPLKEAKTDVLLLDKSTGTVEPLQSLEVAQVTLDEVFHKHFLNMFMLARENFTADTAETNYYTAAAFMSPQLQEQWGNMWKPESPNNPLSIYKSSKVQANIASIVLKPKDDGQQNVATIRFNKSVEGSAGKEQSRFWVATVTYRLVDAPKDEKDRRINPIGFEVIDYRIDPEIPGVPSAKASQGHP